MKDKEIESLNANDSPARQRSGRGRSVLNFLAGGAIVLCALGVFAYWMMHRPRADRRKPVQKTTLVETVPIQKETHGVIVRAMGTVLAAEQVECVAQVSGKVVMVDSDLAPGGTLKKGKVLASVDRREYELDVAAAEAALRQAELSCKERKLAIRQRAAEVVQAEENLTLEEAERDVARSEYDLFADKNADPDIEQSLSNDPSYETWGTAITQSEKDLILREPYLKTSRAAMESARAGHEAAEVAHENTLAACDQAETALKSARLNLEWTSLVAPFDAVVLEKNIGTGSYVSPGSSVATLVNTDRYWIEVSVPVNDLKWIETRRNNGDRASEAKVYYETAWGQDVYRTGTVLEVQPDIETEGRMAKVLIEVEDPRSLQPENRSKPVLLLNSCVNVHIEGKALENIVKLPRGTLRDGENAWVLTSEGTLEIRPVTIAARTPEYVLVADGLEPGMRLIASDIPTAVEGMKLQEHGAGTGLSDAGGERKGSPARKPNDE